MVRSMRIFMFLLLVGMCAVSLFSTPYSAKAQAEQPPPLQQHIVQAGEDLSTIAARYQVTPSALVRLNHLPTPVQLVAGQRLFIPTPLPPGSEPVDAEPLAPDQPAAAPNTPEGLPQPQPVVPEPVALENLTGEKWIDINLTTQTLTAYHGETAVRSFVVSTGGTGHETVTGSFRIWAKVAKQDMSGGSRAAGDYYYVPNVPWVQYFYADYSIHGADWHNDFGWPVSHGCVNMRVEEAHWLFEWAAPSINAALVESATWVFPTEDSTRVEVHD